MTEDVGEAVRRQREQQAAEAWLCGELFTDADEFPHDPPPRPVRNVIRDLSEYNTQPTEERSK